MTIYRLIFIALSVYIDGSLISKYMFNVRNGWSANVVMATSVVGIRAPSGLTHGKGEQGDTGGHKARGNRGTQGKGERTNPRGRMIKVVEKEN